MNKRAEIIAALQQTSSFQEQARLVVALDKHDAQVRQEAEQARSWDAADAIVRDTLTPVRVHEYHTGSTDWLGQVEAAASDANGILAEAALWYSRVSPEVKADEDEFMEQARGKMRREASRYGDDAVKAYEDGMSYLEFLHKRGASGLDQIQQTVAPDGITNKPTELPTDVFDNFAPEVDPVNEGVVGTETSDRQSPAAVNQVGGGGEGQGEWGEAEDPWPGGKTSVALGYLFNLDDFAREAASGLDQIEQTIDPNNKDKTTPLPPEVAFPWTLGEENPQAEDDVSDGAAAIDKVSDLTAEAAGEPIYHESYGMVTRKQLAGYRKHNVSPSDHDYLVDHYGEDDHDAIDKAVRDPKNHQPGSDMFSTFQHAERQATGGSYYPGGDDPYGDEARAAHESAKKTADMYGGTDLPHSTPDMGVANSPATTPAAPASLTGPQGHSDAVGGNAATVSDPHAGAAPYAYDTSYGDGLADALTAVPKDVPYSLHGASRRAARDVGDVSDTYCPSCGTEGPEYDGHSCGACGYEKGKTDKIGSRKTACADCGDENEDTGHMGCQYPGRRSDPNSRDAARKVASKCMTCEAGHHNKCEDDSGDTCSCASKRHGKTSALFVTAAVKGNKDFVKGYGFATKWTSGKPLVKRGSAEFEGGLYAGITDSPATQVAWVEAHRKWASKYPEFKNRIGLHYSFSEKVAAHRGLSMRGAYLAATTTDIDMSLPATTPAADGSTPQNGPGKPGPLAGQQGGAEAGGPSPYQGAEPYGKPVVPSGAQASAPSPTDFLVNDIPGGPLDGNVKAANFRRTAQANLLRIMQEG